MWILGEGHRCGGCWWGCVKICNEGSAWRCDLDHAGTSRMWGLCCWKQTTDMLSWAFISLLKMFSSLALSRLPSVWSSFTLNPFHPWPHTSQFVFLELSFQLYYVIGTLDFINSKLSFQTFTFYDWLSLWENTVYDSDISLFFAVMLVDVEHNLQTQTVCECAKTLWCN